MNFNIITKLSALILVLSLINCSTPSKSSDSQFENTNDSLSSERLKRVDSMSQIKATTTKQNQNIITGPIQENNSFKKKKVE